MKLATYSVDGKEQLGVVVGDGVVSIAKHLPDAPRTMIELVQNWSQYAGPVGELQGRAADVDLDAVRLCAPVPRPGKVLAIGLNYKDHIAETGMETPDQQTWFAKMPTSVAGPYDAIELPAVSDDLDYEAELVMVIGKRARNVPRDRAHEVIFGFCTGNDVSVRDWQLRVSQWIVGKSFDTHAPFGPWITTSDETDGSDLGIRCLVNGEVRQSSNTRHLLFDCLAQIEMLSQAMTLEPGDVIFTGTPGGVGMGSKPPAYLKAGDVVRVEIDTLGHIENRVVPGSTTTIIE
ncbi:fumarylacetoacetate hydrolase family protein [Croceicoccus sediminis]|uniref:fumarylacetoacetate hydrolase family protein n=1 Tax=Croceicoccus sediminis TaxID=2571150 RepID=UPI0011844493|nr:fumarylacetoacetate hydrolase family protein [Croceicoccus sediminis]